MSKKDKLEMIKCISSEYSCEASEESKLEIIRLILNLKGDELELGELPENIKFMGEDENGNGIYKVS